MAAWNPEANDLFLNALEIRSLAERAAYLDQACGGDAALQAQVEALLSASARAGSFLEQPVLDQFTGPEAAGTLAAASPAEGPGTVIGPYRLLEQIGEGGMGTVWMAEQQQPVRRLVALKVIKAGMDSAQVIARFEAERQALALMDHPHIARVFDGGTTEAGRPYFVMELVKGTPITRYCDEHRMTPRQRLELFVPVCQAIQHAHQKGIIHRDVKPSNLLVAPYDGVPVVKVIDFGVAKATGQQLTEKTLYTGFGAVVGTLEYMSPEQAELNNRDIDTRSDVYSLGVLLYELLTGTTPLNRESLQQTPLPEVLRLIREQDPPRPSTRLNESKGSLPAISAQRQTEPAKLTKLVRGELDWIVMKALEKDRERRYETANGLAKDVERYLNDEPVLACPPSLGYRLRKFARKNRRLLVTVGGFVGLLVLGVVGLGIGLVRLAAEQQKTQAALTAEREVKQHTRLALDTLVDDVVESRFGREAGLGLGDEEKEYLRKVIGFYETFADQLGETAEARAARARGQFQVARLQAALGHEDEADVGYRRAAELLEGLAKEVPDDPGYRESLADCLGHWGDLLRVRGSFEDAEQKSRRALVLWERLRQDFSDRPGYRLHLATEYDRLLKAVAEQAKFGEAKQACNRAQSLLAELVGEFPKDLDYRYQLARTYRDLGETLLREWKLAEAEKSFRRALELHEALAGEFPGRRRPTESLAHATAALADVLMKQKKYADAEPVFRQALARWEQLAAEYPSLPGIQAQLATTYDLLVRLLAAQERFDDAEDAGRRGLVIRKALATRYPAVPEHRLTVANSYNSLGCVLRDRGNVPEAEKAFRQAIEFLDALVRESPNTPAYLYRLGLSCTNLGNLLRASKRFAFAEQAYLQALSPREKLAKQFPAVPSHQWELLEVRCKLGRNFRLQNQPDQALVWLDEALAGLPLEYRNAPGRDANRERLGEAHYERALTLGDLGRHRDALAHWDRAVELARPAQRPQMQMERADCRARAGQAATAVADVAALTRDPATPGPQLYDAACVCSLAAAGAGDGGEREAYAGQALVLLRRARDGGYFKDRQRVEHLKKDADLDPLRKREDFAKFVAELEAAGKR
jgi:serine/threonine protein kinase